MSKAFQRIDEGFKRIESIDNNSASGITHVKAIIQQLNVAAQKLKAAV